QVAGLHSCPVSDGVAAGDPALRERKEHHETEHTAPWPTANVARYRKWPIRPQPDEPPRNKTRRFDDRTSGVYRRRISICPLRTRVWYHGWGVRAGPRCTVPSVRQKTLPCQGQVTPRSVIVPCSNGPPAWLQTLPIARIRSPCRYSRTAAPALSTRRDRPVGSSDSARAGVQSAGPPSQAA